MLIDTFKITVDRIQNRIRTWLFKVLVSILSKLDPHQLSTIVVAETIKVKLLRYVPKDGKWHHFAMTVDTWIKSKEKVSRKRVYVDGKKISKRSKNS